MITLGPIPCHFIAFDPVRFQGSGAGRQRAAERAAEDQNDARQQNELTPHSFVFVQFDREPGSQGAENARLANFTLPWCLAELGHFEPADSVNENFKLPIANWYHAEKYDAKWNPWRIKTKGSGKSGVRWGGRAEDVVLRGSVTLADVTFTRTAGVLDAQTKKKLKTSPGAKYAQHAKKP